MRINERKLRRLIRQVILESADYREHLNNHMTFVLDNLVQDLRHKEEFADGERFNMINMAISRMGKEWNQKGGNQTGGSFVHNCDVGIEMHEIQLMVHENPDMTSDAIISELDSVFDVIANCNFPELEGKKQDTFYS